MTALPKGEPRACALYVTTVNDLVAVIAYYGLALVFLIDIFKI